MKLTKTFAPKSSRDVLNLIEQYPLAWVVSALDSEIQATPLPLLSDCDSHGELVSLTGHFARSNPQLKTLEKCARALVIFSGPQGYISPSWLNDRKQAPTWNFVAAQFVVDIELFEKEVATRDALERLVTAMEAHHREPWSTPELQERYDRLFPAIVGFRAHILETRAKFKLGQNERSDVYDDIIAALSNSGNHALLTWMQCQSRDAS
jgi:transcriptional regulator